MTPADIESLETAFSKLDLNGNGSLCQQEILDIVPQEDLRTLLNDMDNDGDGKIDYGEFLSGMRRNLEEPAGLKMLKEAFCVFDGGDGVVTKKYLKLSIMNSGRASCSEVEEMLDTLDTDKDGNLALEDFMRIFVEKERPKQWSQQARKRICQIL